MCQRCNKSRVYTGRPWATKRGFAAATKLDRESHGPGARQPKLVDLHISCAFWREKGGWQQGPDHGSRRSEADGIWPFLPRSIQSTDPVDDGATPRIGVVVHTTASRQVVLRERAVVASARPQRMLARAAGSVDEHSLGVPATREPLPGLVGVVPGQTYASALVKDGRFVVVQPVDLPDHVKLLQTCVVGFVDVPDALAGPFGGAAGGGSQRSALCGCVVATDLGWGLKGARGSSHARRSGKDEQAGSSKEEMHRAVISAGRNGEQIGLWKGRQGVERDKRRHPRTCVYIYIYIYIYKDSAWVLQLASRPSGLAGRVLVIHSHLSENRGREGSRAPSLKGLVYHEPGEGRLWSGGGWSTQMGEICIYEYVRPCRSCENYLT